MAVGASRLDELAVLEAELGVGRVFVAGGLRGDFYDFNNSGSNGGYNFGADEWLLNPTAPNDNVVMESLRAAGELGFPWCLVGTAWLFSPLRALFSS